MPDSRGFSSCVVLSGYMPETLLEYIRQVMCASSHLKHITIIVPKMSRYPSFKQRSCQKGAMKSHKLNLFIHEFLPSFLLSFLPSFLRPSLPPFIYLFIHSFIYLFIYSFIYCFFFSFICDDHHHGMGC